MGTDSGACTRAALCKAFASALTQTAAGGEIDVLDPASYGMVTITKAISIVNDGVGAAASRGGRVDRQSLPQVGRAAQCRCQL
jgi:hypothetical protein